MGICMTFPNLQIFSGASFYFHATFHEFHFLAFIALTKSFFHFWLGKEFLTPWGIISSHLTVFDIVEKNVIL